MIYTLERVFYDGTVEWETFTSLDSATYEWLYDIENTNFLTECYVLMHKDADKMPYPVRRWRLA